MKVPGVVGINKKPFKYPTSTMARGTSLQDNNAKRTECVFAHESLMITETDDITKRVSVKVLRLPEPPKLNPIRMPSHLQRRNTIRRSSKVRPSSETCRRVQQRMLKNQTQMENLSETIGACQQQQQQQQKFAERQKKRSIKSNSHQQDDSNNNKKKNYDVNYYNDKNKRIYNNSSNISTTSSNSHHIDISPPNHHHYHHHLHYIHPERDIFMPAVAEALLNERANILTSVTEAKAIVGPTPSPPGKKIIVVQQDSTPYSISYSCSYYSSSSISTSLTTPQHPPPPPPPSFTAPSCSHYYNRKQRKYAEDNNNSSNKIGYMFQWISSRVQNAFMSRNVKKSKKKNIPYKTSTFHMYASDGFA